MSLPAELPHWWGGRRGRGGGRGASLWGATGRDGMGGPGAGAMGVSGANSYSCSSCHALSEHVQNHCTRTLHVSHLYFSFSLFLYLLWTDLCTPLLDLSLCLVTSLFSCLLHDLRECREMAAHKTEQDMLNTSVLTKCRLMIFKKEANRGVNSFSSTFPPSQETNNVKYLQNRPQNCIVVLSLAA